MLQRCVGKIFTVKSRKVLGPLLKAQGTTERSLLQSKFLIQEDEQKLGT